MDTDFKDSIYFLPKMIPGMHCYVHDIYAGQFIELAAYYEPENLIEPGRAIEDKLFSRTHRKGLIELARKMRR